MSYKRKTGKMQSPKNPTFPDKYLDRWYYQELVVRFSYYKDPIQPMGKLAKQLGIDKTDLARIVRQDVNRTHLAADWKHVWSTDRCMKLREATP